MRSEAGQQRQERKVRMRQAAAAVKVFPAGSATLFGVGFGAFFDGIVFHQLLQWHHMVSSWYPPSNLPNLRLNTVWDGLFHSAALIVMVCAVYGLLQAARKGQHVWSGRALGGAILLGWGLFNVVEGVIDHVALGVHHVNEFVDVSQRWQWDAGFLLWGAVMVALGWGLVRSGQTDRGTTEPAG